MIRLADREGHFRGKGLSITQRFCGRVMLYLEQRAHAQGELDAIKRSLMTMAPAELGPELFPQYFPAEEWSEDIEPGTGFQIKNVISDDQVDEYLAAMGVSPRVR